MRRCTGCTTPPRRGTRSTGAAETSARTSPTAAKGRRKSIKKSFERAMEHEPYEWTRPAAERQRPHICHQPIAVRLSSNRVRYRATCGERSGAGVRATVRLSRPCSRSAAASQAPERERAGHGWASCYRLLGGGSPLLTRRIRPHQVSEVCVSVTTQVLITAIGARRRQCVSFGGGGDGSAVPRWQSGDLIRA